jgi:hypothetical protein
MTFQFTIARKLVGLGLFAILSLAASGIAGLVARHYLTVGADQVLGAQQALRQNLEADQAHDVLRGDVLAAMLSSSVSGTEAAKEARAQLEAHATELMESVQKVEGMELDAPPGPRWSGCARRSRRTSARPGPWRARPAATTRPPRRSWMNSW